MCLQHLICICKLHPILRDVFFEQKLKNWDYDCQVPHKQDFYFDTVLSQNKKAFLSVLPDGIVSN
jgi:hypothetical protein